MGRARPCKSIKRRLPPTGKRTLIMDLDHSDTTPRHHGIKSRLGLTQTGANWTLHRIQFWVETGWRKVTTKGQHVYIARCNYEFSCYEKVEPFKYETNDADTERHQLSSLFTIRYTMSKSSVEAGVDKRAWQKQTPRPRREQLLSI